MKFHIVRNGETLKQIAFLYGLEDEELKKENKHIRMWDNLVQGTKLKIPIIPESVDSHISAMEPFVEDYYPKLKLGEDLHINVEKQDHPQDYHDINENESFQNIKQPQDVNENESFQDTTKNQPTDIDQEELEYEEHQFETVNIPENQELIVHKTSHGHIQEYQESQKNEKPKKEERKQVERIAELERLKEIESEDAESYPEYNYQYYRHPRYVYPRYVYPTYGYPKWRY